MNLPAAAVYVFPEAVLLQRSCVSAERRHPILVNPVPNWFTSTTGKPSPRTQPEKPE
jgi:hypothetical protein